MALTQTRPSYRPFAVEVAAENLSPTFRRLTLTGPDLHACGDTLLDQRVKVVLAEPTADLVDSDWYTAWRELPAQQRPAVRTYTLAAVDRDRGRVCIDFACRPAHGPASAFAAAASRGTRFVLVAPDSMSPASATDGIAWKPATAGGVLLVGDETALPAIRNILAALPPDSTGQAILDLPHIHDAVDLVAPAGVQIDIVARHGSTVGEAAQALLAPWFPTTPTSPGRGDDHPSDELLWEEAQEAAPEAQRIWCAGEAT